MFNLDSFEHNQDFNFLNSLNNCDLFNYNEDDNYVDSPYHNVQLQCKYLDETQYISQFSKTKDITFLSFNIQSLPAKFSEFNQFIHNLFINNCAPDVILLQETWRIIDPNYFNLEGYHPLIYKSRRSGQGGG